MKYNIQLRSKRDLELLIQCIHKCYYRYNEDYDDEDVYALNTELDNLLDQVKKAQYK